MSGVEVQGVIEGGNGCLEAHLVALFSPSICFEVQGAAWGASDLCWQT